MPPRKVSRSAFNVGQSIFDTLRLRRQARQIRTIGIWSALLLLIILLLVFGVYYLLYPYGWNEEIQPTIRAWLQDKNAGLAYQYEFDKLAEKYDFDYNEADSLYSLFFFRPQDVYNILNDIHEDAATFNNVINNLKTQSTLGGKIDVLLTLDQKVPLSITPLGDIVTFLKANPDIVSFLKAHPELTLNNIVQIAKVVQENQSLVNFLTSNPNIDVNTVITFVSQLQKAPLVLDLIKSTPDLAKLVAGLAGIDLSGVSDDELVSIANTIPQIDLSLLQSFDLNSIPRDQLTNVLNAVGQLNISQLQGIDLDAVDQVQPITIPIQKEQIDVAYIYVNVWCSFLVLSVVGLIALYATNCLRMSLYRWPGIKVNRTWIKLAFILFPLFWVINFLLYARVCDAIANRQRSNPINNLKLIQIKKPIKPPKAKSNPTGC